MQHDNQTFSLERIYKLSINDILTHRKLILIAIATIFVFLIVIPYHAVSNIGVYYFMLFAGGFVLTTRAFNDMHDYERAYRYLTLPCSNLERLVSKWLLTTIVYALGLLVLYYIFALFGYAVNLLIFKYSHKIYSPLNLDLWIVIGKYIVLQAIILLGAVYFKKYALIKTLLAIGCFLIFIAIFSIIVTWINCPSCFFGSVTEQINISIRGASMIFWIIVAPICWYITYLRITECELR